jgi:hypothetical protein
LNATAGVGLAHVDGVELRVAVDLFGLIKLADRAAGNAYFNPRPVTR